MNELTLPEAGGEVRRHHLGPIDRHTVYEAEVVGSVLALDIIRHTPRIRLATILLDNQSAISSLSRPSPKSGQIIVEEFLDQVTRILSKRKRLHIRVVWVPGHSDEPGNELADEQAKAAAAGDAAPCRSPCRLLTRPLPTSSAAVKAASQKRLTAKWKEEWAQSTRGGRLARSLDRSGPRSGICPMLLDLPRRHASIIMQLRTGHVSLNAFLHRIKAVDSPLCVRCGCPESVQHFLITCQRFNRERHALRMKVKGLFTIRNLLGNKKNRPALIKYIDSTKRFPLYLPQHV